MTTWYIAPTGNDTTGDGSEGNPYLKVSKCHTVGANGDTVICADGTYYENNTTISKTSFTVQAAAGATPVFIAATLYTSWDKTGGYTNVYEKTTSQSFGVWNGTTYLTKASSIANCDATTNSWYWDGTKTYVNIGGGDPDDIGGLLSSTTPNFVFTLSGAGSVVDGLTLHWGMRGILLSAAATARNCRIRYLNQYDGGAYGAIVSQGDGALIEGCTIEHVRDTASGYTAGNAITTNTGAANLTVRNTIIRYANSGIKTYIGTGHVIEGCTIDQIRGHAIFVDDATAATARRNTCYDCNAGVIVQDTGVLLAHHNIVAARSNITTATGVRWGYIVEAAATAQIYHNVCANLRSVVTDSGAAYLCKGTSTGTFYNNISYNNCCGYKGNGTDTPTLTADYNLSYNDTTAYDSTWNGGAAGPHDLALNPLFRNPAISSEDFRLLQQSPCIDAGALIAGINEGYRGRAPDLGPLEYTRPRPRRHSRFSWGPRGAGAPPRPRHSARTR